MKDQNTYKFYPNQEYNRKRRNKYFVMFAVLITLILLMDAWFVTEKYYVGLLMNLFILFFIFLIPKTLRENPVKNQPILTLSPEGVTVHDKKLEHSVIKEVKAIVYLGSIGNALENRKLLEEAAASRPEKEMFGSLEIVFEEDGRQKSEIAVIENVVEALCYFVEEGKVTYKLGYSLGKEYRLSTYNLKEMGKQEDSAEGKKQSKTKQLL